MKTRIYATPAVKGLSEYVMATHCVMLAFSVYILSETQLQVGENSDWIIWRLKG